jgi:hypothetical protein
MKNKILIFILFSGLFSCDFICPPEKGKSENKISDSTRVKEIQVQDDGIEK